MNGYCSLWCSADVITSEDTTYYTATSVIGNILVKSYVSITLNISSKSTAIGIMNDRTTCQINVCVLPNNTGLAATIDRTIHSTATDAKRCVSTYSSSGCIIRKTKSTTEDVTACIGCTNQATALNIHIRIILNETTLTTSIDRTFDFGSSVNSNMGVSS